MRSRLRGQRSSKLLCCSARNSIRTTVCFMCSLFLIVRYFCCKIYRHDHLSLRYYSHVYKQVFLYLDKDGLFLKRNFNNIEIPDTMQTFLVDRNGKVLFVGNPIYNQNVEKELIKIINR